MGKLDSIYRFLLGAAMSAVIAVSAYSCKARLDIDTSDATQRIAIYGYLTNDEKAHKITVRRTQSYFSKDYPDGVSGAEVYITTSGGEIIHLTESAEESGVYLTENTVKGLEGETYTLYVKVDWNGDGKIESYEASSKMLFKSTIERTELNKSNNFTDYIELLLWGSVPEDQECFYNFQVSRNDENILNDSLRNFVIIDSKYYHSEVKGVTCYFFDQDEERYKLKDGDLVTLHMAILTREYGFFLKNSRKEIKGSMPLFGGPPAMVKGNIVQTIGKDRATPVGFFSAYPVSRHSAVYNEE